MILMIVALSLFLLWLRLPRETRSSLFWLVVLVVLLAWAAGMLVETIAS